MINAIIAFDFSGGMGFNGGLPWGHLPEDLKHFKKITENSIVVMGRKTWESLPNAYRPLPNRINVVVTSTPVTHPGFFIHNFSPYQIKEQCDTIQGMFPDKKLFIIGGKTLLMSMLNTINLMYVTRVQGTYESDVSLNLSLVLNDFDLYITRPPINKCIFEEYRRK